MDEVQQFIAWYLFVNFLFGLIVLALAYIVKSDTAKDLRNDIEVFGFSIFLIVMTFIGVKIVVYSLFKYFKSKTENDN